MYGVGWGVAVINFNDTRDRDRVTILIPALAFFVQCFGTFCVE
jgi:hypothetical protein